MDFDNCYMKGNITMSQFKRKLTAFSAMLAFLSVSTVATLGAEVGDVIGNTGNMNISGGGNNLDVSLTDKTAGAVGQVDWNKFNVPGNQTVNFGFGGVSQTIINRVLGGESSKILGHLRNSCTGANCTNNALTGKVILINPAGVLFGAGSTVDLNSFTTSTFDIKGIKNLSDVTDMDAYQTGTLNLYSPVASVNDEGRSYAKIEFDSKYQDNFKDIQFATGKVKFDGGTYDASTPGKITLNGTHFNKFVNGSTTEVDAWNTNKTTAFIADNIDYKDSIIKTGTNYNYLAGGAKNSYGNVQLITADGATFTYLAHGYSSSTKVADDSRTDVVRNINIDNSGLGADQVGIQSGVVDIVNKSKADGSNIKIKNAVVKGTKLVDNESGIVLIDGSHDVDIEGSRIQSTNTKVTYAGETTNTDKQVGGQVIIKAGDGLKVKDSLIYSAGSKGSQADNMHAGIVQLYAYNGNIDMTNSQVLAESDADIIASNEVNITDSLIESSNSLVEDKLNHINIVGYDGVNVTNSTLSSRGDVNLHSVASADNSLRADVNVKNSFIRSSNGKLSIKGANSTIDNSNLAYNTISFYGDGTTGLNNVTVKGDSTFTQKLADGNVSPDVILETNGNFTMDNATMKTADVSIAFDRDADGKLVDDGTQRKINFTTTATGKNANNVNVKSTQGSVTAKNNSNVQAKDTIAFTANTDVNVVNSTLGTTTGDVSGDITLTATTGNAKLDGASIDSAHNVTISAAAGSLEARNGSNIVAVNDINATSLNDITFADEEGTGYITSDVSFTASNNINFTATAGDITAENATAGQMASLTYDGRLKFDAVNNNFNAASLKSVNVDYVASASNNIVTTGDVQFVNSTLEGPQNNITSGSDVIMNNLTIVDNDATTTIIAKGDITTADVTGTFDADMAAGTHTFPQTVDVNRVTPVNASTHLDLNGSKLIAKAQTVKDAANPNKGSITLNLKNADGAGIDLLAENVDADGNHLWDSDINASQGPEVHLKSADGKSIAVSRIVTDKLFIDENTNISAAAVELTPDQLAHFEGTVTNDNAKGYIEIRDKGGFNQDASSDLESTPDGFVYDEHFERTDTEGEDGEVTSNYGSHTIVYNPNKGGDQFLLVYEKEGQTCDPLPIVPPNVDGGTSGVDPDIDSMINNVKIPREQQGTSMVSVVGDASADRMAATLSAAAKIDVGEDAQATYTSDDDEYADED